MKRKEHDPSIFHHNLIILYFSISYQKGKRLVFTSQVEKRAKPSTSTKQGSREQGEEQIEHDFELVDIEVADEPSNSQQIIKEKDSQIKELMDNVARARFVISFLEQENNKLKAKQFIMEKERSKVLQQGVKVKVVLELGELDEHDKKV